MEVAEKRVQIAQEVLERINTHKFIPKRGSYGFLNERNIRCGCIRGALYYIALEMGSIVPDKDQDLFNHRFGQELSPIFDWNAQLAMEGIFEDFWTVDATVMMKAMLTKLVEENGSLDFYNSETVALFNRSDILDYFGVSESKTVEIYSTQGLTVTFYVDTVTEAQVKYTEVESSYQAVENPVHKLHCLEVEQLHRAERITQRFIELQERAIAAANKYFANRRSTIRDLTLELQEQI